MAVQQQKKSKQKIRQRKAANRYRGFQTNICAQCGDIALPHRACPSCGYYKGKKVEL
ncbi:MAG: 50S ribosomal protein L32 [Lentisphaeria bacterium]|nr:50S ribosomal protein L32 [Lentisphaeria bacterium]